MPFNVDEFNAEIGRRGVAKASLFYVLVHAPAMISINPGAKASGLPTQRATSSLPMRVTSAALPGRSLLTLDQRYSGPLRMIPYGFTVPPLTATVLQSEDMYERQFFLQWGDLFVGQARTEDGGSTPGGVWDTGYYDDCIGRIEILQFGESPGFQGVEKDAGGFLSTIKDLAETVGFDTSIVTNPFGLDVFGLNGKTRVPDWVTKTTLHEVYPRTVNDVQLDWSNDGPALLNVEFVYRHFTEVHKSVEAAGFKSLQDDKSMLRRTIESLQRFIPVASAIKNLGAGGAIRAAGSAVGGGATNVLSTQRRVLPF